MHGSATAFETDIEAAPDPVEAAPEVAEPKLRLTMERCAGRLKDLILSQPPRKLVGYIWAQRALGPTDQGEGEDAAGLTFLLQYVHAVVACFGKDPAAAFDEEVSAEIITRGADLYAATRRYCEAQAGDQADKARDTERVAKRSWVWPAHRPATLEEEFLTFVLAPHDQALRKRHGIGASDIVKRLVAIPDVVRSVQESATAAIDAQMTAVGMLAEERSIEPEDAAALWGEEQPEKARAATRAYAELLDGRLCNLSAHTDLPITLLRDMSYEPGSEQAFFSSGDLSGTPLRALPGRRKPLIRLSGDFFAPDPGLVRETAYRALTSALGGADGDPDFSARHTAASVNAFARALPDQLKGARIDAGVCYRDVHSHEWAEGDLLIRLDDVLIVVDARAGAAAASAPLAAGFDQHVQDVLKTVASAYGRCRSFLDYLASAAEVPLFRRNGGRIVEHGRIRLSDYRLILPIGLSVEPLAPFSAMCAALPSIQPILSRHTFMAMSIDDLLVLRRVLPTREEFLDYMQFRQEAVGDKSAPRYFEADHLADYAASVAREVAEQPLDPVPAPQDAATEPVAQAIESEAAVAAEPEPEGMPDALRPREIGSLLSGLKRAAEPGWQRARDAILAREGAESERLAAALRDAGAMLGTQEARWLYDPDEPPLFLWLQRYGTRADITTVKNRAKATAIARGARSVMAILVHAKSASEYSRAVSVGVLIPPPDSTEYRRYRAEAAETKARDERTQAQAQRRTEATATPRKVGRNEPCWCGSGKKFKRCHGGA